jgi:hypothetical protein
MEEFLSPDRAFIIPDPVLFITAALSAVAAGVVAYYFFRLYRISGLSHLLGIPVGFTFLAASHALFGTGLWMENDTKLHNMALWTALITLSYSFSMIAMSYHYRSAEFNERTRLIKVMSYAVLPVIGLLAVIEMSTQHNELISFQAIDEYFTAFNVIALAYIFLQCMWGIVKGDKPKRYHIPAGFASLLIGQFLILDWMLYQHTTFNVISAIMSLLGPTLFIYMLHKSLRGDRIAKTAET